MKVFVNDTEIMVFHGATARDATLAYFTVSGMSFGELPPLIFDRYGNVVEPDGALAQNTRLFIQKPENLNYDE